MYFVHAAARHDDHPPGELAVTHSPGTVYRNRRWQQHWWSTRPAPQPNWLQRLELGIPLPRQLRR